MGIELELHGWGALSGFETGVSPLDPSQNSVSSHEKRGGTKKRKAPQPPASTPMPVRETSVLGRRVELREAWNKYLTGGGTKGPSQASCEGVLGAVPCLGGDPG